MVHSFADAPGGGFAVETVEILYESAEDGCIGHLSADDPCFHHFTAQISGHFFLEPGFYLLDEGRPLIVINLGIAQIFEMSVFRIPRAGVGDG
jgi:hypothetical protein